MSFALTDQRGHSRRLAEFRGSPFVASMVYTSCKSVCPRVIEELKSLEAALSPGERDRFRFLLFSLDPERDTPAAMNAFVAGHGLAPSRWTLMAAGPEDMRTIAAVLGVRFRPDGSGEIAHTAMIFAADRDGVVRYRQTGVGNGLGPLLAAVRSIP